MCDEVDFMLKMKALRVKDMGRATVVFALLTAMSSPATADSIFSVNGFGETIIAVDARGMAMGAAGLANPSPGTCPSRIPLCWRT